MNPNELAQQTLKRLIPSPNERLRLADMYGIALETPSNQLLIIKHPVPDNDHEAIAAAFRPHSIMVIMGIIPDEP